MSFAVTLAALNRSVWKLVTVLLTGVVASASLLAVIECFPSLCPCHQDHIRYLYLKSTEAWKPPSFSAVDVLNYFCSVREEEQRKARAPVGHDNTVLLPLYDWYVEVKCIQ